MKFVPEVGAGTRILKVKLPGYEKNPRERGRSPSKGRGEAPTWRGPKALATVLPDEHEHPNPMIMNCTGFLTTSSPSRRRLVSVSPQRF